MSEYSDDAGIMYPAVFPQNTDLPIDYEIDAHSTLMYLGDKNDLDFETLVSALKPLEFEDVGIVDVDGLSLFGEDGEVLVMRLKSGNLDSNFQMVEDALRSVGVENASEFDYNPHITLSYEYYGPTEGFTQIPTTVGLGKPQLWWGDDRIDF